MAFTSLIQIQAIKYVCGHCGVSVGTDRGMTDSRSQDIMIVACPHCEVPSVNVRGTFYPSPLPGAAVAGVPKEIENLYDEARACVSANASTGSVLLSRKLLMNVSVAQGAKPNMKFIEYVDFLESSGYIPPNGRGWVDHIRRKGNEATHEIATMNKTDATELISFCEMLLRFIYEFPSRIPASN